MLKCYILNVMNSRGERPSGSATRRDALKMLVGSVMTAGELLVGGTETSAGVEKRKRDTNKEHKERPKVWGREEVQKALDEVARYRDSIPAFTGFLPDKLSDVLHIIDAHPQLPLPEEIEDESMRAQIYPGWTYVNSPVVPVKGRLKVSVFDGQSRIIVNFLNSIRIASSQLLVNARMMGSIDPNNDWTEGIRQNTGDDAVKITVDLDKEHSAAEIAELTERSNAQLHGAHAVLVAKVRPFGVSSDPQAEGYSEDRFQIMIPGTLIHVNGNEALVQGFMQDVPDVGYSYQERTVNDVREMKVALETMFGRGLLFVPAGGESVYSQLPYIAHEFICRGAMVAGANGELIGLVSNVGPFLRGEGRAGVKELPTWARKATAPAIFVTGPDQIRALK